VDYIACSYQNLQTPISKAGCSLFRLSAEMYLFGLCLRFPALKYSHAPALSIPD